MVHHDPYGSSTLISSSIQALVYGAQDCLFNTYKRWGLCWSVEAKHFMDQASMWASTLGFHKILWKRWCPEESSFITKAHKILPAYCKNGISFDSFSCNQPSSDATNIFLLHPLMKCVPLAPLRQWERATAQLVATHVMKGRGNKFAACRGHVTSGRPTAASEIHFPYLMQ